MCPGPAAEIREPGLRRGDAVADVVQDPTRSLGIKFNWRGKTPATFTRARLQVVEDEHRDSTRPYLSERRVTLKKDLNSDDAGDAHVIADVLSLFNVEARTRGIITRTASPDFSFRTTPPDYTVPELLPDDRQNT